MATKEKATSKPIKRDKPVVYTIKNTDNVFVTTTGTITSTFIQASS